MQLTLLTLSVQRTPTRNLTNPPSALWSSDSSGVVTTISEISDQYAERDCRDKQKELDLFDFVRTGHGSVVAVLLPCSSAGRRFESSAD